MEPRIQYAKTSDGVSIAAYAIGQGPAVLYLANGAGLVTGREGGVEDSAALFLARLVFAP